MDELKLLTRLLITVTDSSYNILLQTSGVNVTWLGL